jgi:hypothetical protein
VRCCGVSEVALGLEASGVDEENVESLTPNAGDVEFGIADLLGVMSAGVDDFEGRLGNFEREELLPNAGGDLCASKFGLRGGMRALGDGGREDGCVVARVGWVPLGVLTVLGRGTSRSKNVLLVRLDSTCSTRCMYRLCAADGALARG